MPEILGPEQFIAKAANIPVLDVRSPAEYAKGHICRAFNLPLFTDEERSVIGTLYVQSGREIAVKQGLEFVGVKFVPFIQEVEKIVAGKEILLHCWRGGMRSESMAWFFEKLGYTIYLLEGGYKAYRKYIRASFEKPSKLVLLGGHTGSGKTEILRILSEMGQQVIDLEGMANHKGSAFGHLGQFLQPSTEQFENNLFDCWKDMDMSRIVWAEHESTRIGSVFLPDTFFKAMHDSTLIHIKVPREIRLKRIVEEYATHDKALLMKSLLNIRDEMGLHNNKIAHQALINDDYEQVVSLTLEYYDKSYSHALMKRPVKEQFDLTLESSDMQENALAILDFTNKIF
ncbi:MAG: tRNA 2-selenouridine(34) synthase MnmH [Bacteroidales bacterium]|nr:tRNA 2-selenouridine(34) synthase MnmH [Bacteroidales bacterium]